MQRSRTHPLSIYDCTRPRIFVCQDALTAATPPSSTTDTIAKAVHLQRDPSIQRRCAARGLAVALLRGVRTDPLSRRGLLLSFVTLVALVAGLIAEPALLKKAGHDHRKVPRLTSGRRRTVSQVGAGLSKTWCLPRLRSSCVMDASLTSSARGPDSEKGASVRGARRSFGLSRSNTKVSSIPSSDRPRATTLL